MKQIDYMKFFSIISVIILHTLPYEILCITLSPFHIWNAVPIFIILSSFTTYISCSKKNLDLKELYNINYFKKKVMRIIHPLLYIYIFTILIGVIFHKKLYFGIKSLALYMPYTGPGNYYIPILFQYVLISPFLFYMYKKNPKKSIIISLLLNIISELLLYFVKDNYLYSSCILRYLFLIFLGFYLFDIIFNKKNIKRNEKIVVIICIILSILYIISTYFYTIPFFNENWKRQLFLADFYPIFLVYLAFKYLIKFEKILDKTIIIGKMSYHIFLIQMIYFSINPIRFILNKFSFNSIVEYLILLPCNILICLLLGYLFYLCTNKIEELINKH